jgi:hypothetical protein
MHNTLLVAQSLLVRPRTDHAKVGMFWERLIRFFKAH